MFSENAWSRCLFQFSFLVHVGYVLITGGASSSCAAAAEPMYVPVSQIHTEAWGESEQTHAHWVHWPTEEGYPYVSNAWPEPQQEEPRGHIGGASRAMPTASNASSS